MLGDAVRGVKLMMLLQLLSRVVTFGLNTLVVRQVAPEVVGAAAQLQLITNLTLFFSREAVPSSHPAHFARAPRSAPAGKCGIGSPSMVRSPRG